MYTRSRFDVPSSNGPVAFSAFQQPVKCGSAVLHHRIKRKQLSHSFPRRMVEYAKLSLALFLPHCVPKTSQNCLRLARCRRNCRRSFLSRFTLDAMFAPRSYVFQWAFCLCNFYFLAVSFHVSYPSSRSGLFE